MATTLRLDEALYREAKAAAAKRGVTITRFIEEALRVEIARGARGAAAGPVSLHTVEGEFPYTVEELKALTRRLDDEYAAKQLGLADGKPKRS